MFGHKGRFRFRETALVRNKRAGTIPNPGRRPVPEYKTRFPACWFGDSFPYSTENPTNEYAKRHPTVKGQEFVEWLIQMTTDRGDLVVDPFAGSGTVAAAAAAVGRRCLSCDLSEEFVALANERLKKGDRNG
jgi:DNA modification methylase